MVIKCRAVGSFFTVRGWVKMSTTMVDRRRKNFKKYWLKHPKGNPLKLKTGPKYKWFKISYFEFFFFLILLWAFLYLSRHSNWHHQSFFLNIRFSSRKSQSQQKLAKKITHFTIQKFSQRFYESQLTWHWN